MVDLVSDPGHGGFGLIFAGGKDPDTQVGAEITIKEVIAGSPAAAQGTYGIISDHISRSSRSLFRFPRHRTHAGRCALVIAPVLVGC